MKDFELLGADSLCEYVFLTPPVLAVTVFLEIPQINFHVEEVY